MLFHRTSRRLLRISLLLGVLPLWIIYQIGNLTKQAIISLFTAVFRLLKTADLTLADLWREATRVGKKDLIVHLPFKSTGEIFKQAMAVLVKSSQLTFDFILRVLLLNQLFSIQQKNKLAYNQQKLQKYHLVTTKRKVKAKKARTGSFALGVFLKRLFPFSLTIGIFLSLVLIILFVYSLFLIVLAKDLPTPNQLSNFNSPLTTEFYDRNGKLLYRLYDDKNRSLINLSDLPKPLIQATIAIEDKNFYNHQGIDLLGVTRATKAYINHEPLQGGSTITQQLIKNTLLTPDRTIQRKIKEVLLAFWTERVFSKDEILQMYFNEVPYGGTAWGIAAAAQTYFDKTPSQLNLAESSYLAGLPASPTAYSPYGNNPQLGKKRQKEVLRRMVEDRYIQQQAADRAYAQELNIRKPMNDLSAPHFVMYVKQLLEDKYGPKLVSQGGLKVQTTLDLEVQQMVENIVSDEIAKLASLNVSNGAAMVTDAKTGQILAMVGSKDYNDPAGGNFNATVALRQPGSSIKPITYATAFKQGYSPGTVMLDTPVVFKNAWETYAPVNYDGQFHGPVSIRTALGSSYNIPAVKMLALIGLPSMINTARDLGITSLNEPHRYGLSLTLGGGEVKLIDMMGVYGTFSQTGMHYTPQPILAITNSNGKVVEDNQTPQGKRVLDPAIAYMITDILADNKARTPAFGPDSLLKIPGFTVANKTGTTNNKRDNWTFGYTPDFVVGVWVGNFDNSPMSPDLTSGITGAAPIWNKIITDLIQGREDVAFVKPDNLTLTTVDGNKDWVMNGLSSKTVVALGRKTIKDDKTNTEKESITFTDPFSTYTLDPAQNQPPVQQVPSTR